ncbi:MAG: hypothetical protein IT168_06555 [Bryobacterales bacterium]|nr:hypothetical protein [Bryobacterales bacterium]
MSLFRDEVVEFALSDETRKLETEQKAWIARDPLNPQPYYQLALVYRMQYDQDTALALLLHSTHLDPAYAPAHIALTEIYAVRADYPAAWRHAKLAAQNGKEEGITLLLRHNIAEPPS